MGEAVSGDRRNTSANLSLGGVGHEPRTSLDRYKRATRRTLASIQGGRDGPRDRPCTESAHHQPLPRPSSCWWYCATPTYSLPKGTQLPTARRSLAPVSVARAFPVRGDDVGPGHVEHAITVEERKPRVGDLLERDKSLLHFRFAIGFHTNNRKLRPDDDIPVEQQAPKQRQVCGLSSPGTRQLGHRMTPRSPSESEDLGGGFRLCRWMSSGDSHCLR